MGISDDFKTFLDNIKIDNAATIALRYGEVTASLNKEFRDTESKTANSLQVGSYGRWTAIKGISDLDIIYIMPAGKWDTYKEGGQNRLLHDARDAIKRRYPSTTVKVDRLVVRVLYNNFHIEVMPAFKLADGSYKYPDNAKGGSWKITKPQAELDEMREANERKNRNLRHLCKMARAWKNKQGVAMGGLLIDTLAYNFLESTDEYDTKSFHYYDYMCRDFFKFLADQPKQSEYAALGSRQRVRVKKRFERKAKKVDIRYHLRINCEVTQDGFRPGMLRDLLERHGVLLPKKSLRFFIADATDLPDDAEVFWKVLNRGEEAERRDMIRGQIVRDEGRGERRETTNFRGDHLVECYAVSRGVVVARDTVRVPIRVRDAEDEDYAA